MNVYQKVIAYEQKPQRNLLPWRVSLAITFIAVGGLFMLFSQLLVVPKAKDAPRPSLWQQSLSYYESNGHVPRQMAGTNKLTDNAMASMIVQKGIYLPSEKPYLKALDEDSLLMCERISNLDIPPYSQCYLWELSSRQRILVDFENFQATMLHSLLKTELDKKV